VKSSPARNNEAISKIDLIRSRLSEGEAVRLRGNDWFFWATAGGSSAVLLAGETGVAEILITDYQALVVTNAIEARRLEEEELPEAFELRVTPWAHPARHEAEIRKAAATRLIFSDRPAAAEEPLAAELVRAKRTLVAGEVERYREVGRLAAEAMTETLKKARPGWSEWELAAAGAGSLWSRGLEPALVLAAGERRLQLYRHPKPTSEQLGNQAMLVFCARGCGLYANLTRFVSFGRLPMDRVQLHRQVWEIERQALEESQPGVALKTVYGKLAQAYAAAGRPTAIEEHHQGGTTGYLSREAIATFESTETIGEQTAVAWNPSLAGAKVEDTFLVTGQGLENLTHDPAWPGVEVGGLQRPQVLER